MLLYNYSRLAPAFVWGLGHKQPVINPTTVDLRKNCAVKTLHLLCTLKMFFIVRKRRLLCDEHSLVLRSDKFKRYHSDIFVFTSIAMNARQTAQDLGFKSS